MKIKKFFPAFIIKLFKALLFVLQKEKQKYFKGKEKLLFRKIYEQIIWLLKENNYNSMYYMYGLHLKGSYLSNYIGKKEFNKLLTDKEKKFINIPKKKNCYLLNLATTDKFYVTSILKSNEISVIDNIALINNGKLIKPKGKLENINSLFSLSFPMIIKNTILEYNEGLYFLNNEGNDFFLNGYKKEKENINLLFSSGSWVIQKPFESSQDIKKINHTALNTTRIYTIMRNGNPFFLGGYQAFATEKSKTDSWGKKSIYVGFDKFNNCLSDKGFYHPHFRKKFVYFHPDSKIKFKGYKINYLNEAIELCKKAHRLFYYTYIIGWDVAITDSGPKILELNDRPGVNALQAINGGIKKVISNPTIR